MEEFCLPWQTPLCFAASETQTQASHLLPVCADLQPHPRTATLPLIKFRFGSQGTKQLLTVGSLICCMHSSGGLCIWCCTGSRADHDSDHRLTDQGGQNETQPGCEMGGFQNPPKLLGAFPLALAGFHISQILRFFHDVQDYLWPSKQNTVEDRDQEHHSHTKNRSNSK